MILTRLREQTRHAHERLEAQINVLERASTLSEYQEMLLDFYGFYCPLEPRLAEVLKREIPEFDFEARRKVCLLERDLETLGICAERFATLPLCIHLPRVETLPQALGCLYVMEGATLGGKIISKHLHETLNIDAANGAAFFDSYGSKTGVMWRSFGTMLIEYTEISGGDEAILESAAQTFAAFEAWFASNHILEGRISNGQPAERG